MAINFTTGEYLIINRAYVRKVLVTLDCDCNAQTIASLGYIGESPAEVLATGTVPTFTSTKSFIRLRPTVSTNPANNSGTGTTIYFCSDAHLNNSFELSTAFIADKCFVKAQNVSGSIITKGQLVYQSGFDGTLQLPNINLASAGAVSTCAVLGLAAADIGIGECGSVLVEGSFVGLDTSAFANIGSTVYLSDTPGEISGTPGTNEKVVARVMSISMTDGTIIMDSVTAGSGGGGGGFFSDGSGTNAGIGKGTVPPTAAGENSLAQGNNVSAPAANSFALGDSVTAGTPYSFVQGGNITMPASGRSNVIVGQDQTITGTAAYQSIIVGYGNTVDDPYDAIVAGYGNDFTNCYGTLGIGFTNTVTTQSYYAGIIGFDNYFANIQNSLVAGVQVQGSTDFQDSAFVGQTHTLSGNVRRTLSVGRNATLTGGIYNSSQIGYLNRIGDTHRNVSVSGYSNFVGTTRSLVFLGGITGTFSTSQTVTGSTSGATGVIIGTPGSVSMVVRILTDAFISGETITTGTGSAVLTSGPTNANTGDQAFAHGSNNFVAGSNSFAQGDSNQILPTLGGLTNNSAAFGQYNSIRNEKSLAVGRSNTAFENSFALGQNCGADDYNTVAIGNFTTTHSLNNFAFGSRCRAGYGDYPGNVAFGGYYAYADGYNSQAFGYYTQITPGSAYSTALGGFATTVEARNCLAHGKTAGADIIGQRAFSAQTASGGSSAGSFPFGPANAQWSFVAHSGGLGNPSTTISIPTDTGRAYSFMVNIVMNATTGDANRGSFVVSQMLAHNSAGTATIVGSPSFTAITDGADIANVTTSITASGANVQFVFTRNAAALNYTLGYWISFMETDT